MIKPLTALFLATSLVASAGQLENKALVTRKEYVVRECGSLAHPSQSGISANSVSFISIETCLSQMQEALSNANPTIDKCVNISNHDTLVTIMDRGNNGLSDDDYVSLFHRFSNGDTLSLNVKYKGPCKYEMSWEILYNQGKNLVSGNKDTYSLNFIERELFRYHEKKILDWGKRTYDNISSPLPNLPVKQFERAFLELEQSLPEIKQTKKFSGRKLARLSGEIRKDK